MKPRLRIDIHTHILPFIDDGAQDLMDARRLLLLLNRQGIEVAVCTPHFNPCLTDSDLFIRKRNRARMNIVGKSRVSLIMGSETYLHDSLLYYANLDFLCIQNTKYLLIELPRSHKNSKNNLMLLQKLINKYDIIPIVAHVERYPWIRKRYLKRLRFIGCVIQVNTSSVLSEQYSAKVINYIKKGFVDVLGSDCHNSMHRPPIIEEALQKLEQMAGETICSELIMKSEYIIRGRDIRKVRMTY